nr:hypothetical protein [Tanacetum cinerariifolium]
GEVVYTTSLSMVYKQRSVSDANNVKDPITPKIAHSENKGRSLRKLTAPVVRNQGASIKTLEIQIGQVSKVLQERGFGSPPSSTEANLRDQVKSISTTTEIDSCLIRHIGSSQYALSTRQNRTLMYESRQRTIPFLSRLNGYYCEEKKGSYGPQFLKAYSEASQSIHEKEKDLGSFTLPFFTNNVCFDNALVDLGSSVSVIPLLTYLNLGLGKLTHSKLTIELADRNVKYLKGIAENMLVRIEKVVYTSVKHASSLIKRFYMLSLRERMELDLEARLIGETLVLNRSLDPFFEDYIELDDLNEPIKLGRNQGDDCMPTIKEGEVSDDDMKNGISHPYQKFKGFYKGVLNLGPDYIRDARIEEWLTRGHISVHEME